MSHNGTGISVRSDYQLDDSDGIHDFGLRLLKQCFTEEENTLISPVSVLCALAMTANGAEGETKTEMEQTLGMTTEQLNQLVYACRMNLSEDKDCTAKLANSIWVTNQASFTPDEDFLQVNGDYYGADIYEAPFDDTTVKEINRWIRTNTDGKIANIIQEIPSTAVMYLINALSFDAEWQVIYKDSQVQTSTFTTESGEKEETEMMYSEEAYYLEHDRGTGVLKPYKGGKYAFAALLPKQGMTVREYLDSMTGEEWKNLLDNVQTTTVNAAIPKFETTYSAEISGQLMELGMTKAFDEEQADFSRLGTSERGNIYINTVFHKTFLTVDEKGTKAGAATAVEMTNRCALVEETKQVYLDRPFVYMIVDMEYHTPLFVGTCMNME